MITAASPPENRCYHLSSLGIFPKLVPFSGVLALLRKAYSLNVPWPLRRRLARWIAGSVVREYPWALGVVNALAIAGLIALGATDSPFGWLAIAALAAIEIALARLALQSLGAGEQLREALAELEGPAERRRSRFPLSHVVFPPLMFWRRGVRRIRKIEFARYGRKRLLLDVYMPAAASEELRPSVVQIHGGGWIAGSRSEQGIPLLNHLASCGWVCFNADYRLSPRATFPDHVIDVKRAIAWVKEHARDYGADPDFICITGGSAGGHLIALAALTADDPCLQPGFEEADTSVAAAVPFYGVYDLTDSEGVHYPELREWVFERHVIKASYEDQPERFVAASPLHRVHADAPPFLVIHGDRDTLVPVEEARAFVRALSAVSTSPVYYAELAGAEHAFDIGPSVRTARVVETIERFLATVRARAARDGASNKPPQQRRGSADASRQAIG
jgi:acetyl esterase/lipase